MDKEIIERWEQGKENLRSWFKEHDQKEYPDYEHIVKVLIEHCLNYETFFFGRLSSDVEVSDHGDYQGTQVFLIHKDCYQPSLYDYYIFSNYYGSCSGCDTLMGIQSENCEGLPSEAQVNAYMTLCLYMVQRMKCLADVLEI